MSRYAILVYDPQRRIGDGIVAGPVSTEAGARHKAASIKWAAERLGLEVETVVLPLRPSATSARQLALGTEPTGEEVAT